MRPKYSKELLIMENKEELKETVSKEENAADFLPKKEKPRLKTVSYTHLTLPTICSV